MKFLLDTCTLLWIALDDKSLSRTAREMFQNPTFDIFLSSASCWEISVKFAIKKLSLPSPPEKFIPELCDTYNIEFIPIEAKEALYIHKLPFLHADPFDRMLVSQALMREMTILTPDPLIEQYAVRVEW